MVTDRCKNLNRFVGTNSDESFYVDLLDYNNIIIVNNIPLYIYSYIIIIETLNCIRF